MPQHVTKQPNGKYAIFSSVVDHFIGYNATPDEVYEHFRQLAIEESDRLTKRSLERADHFGESRLVEDLDTVRRIHGDKEADEYMALLSGPQLQCTCNIGNGLHTDWCPVYLHGMETGIGFGQGSQDGEPPQAKSE